MLGLVSDGCLGRYLIEKGEIQPARTLASFRSRNWKDSFCTSLTYMEIRKQNQGQSCFKSGWFLLQTKGQWFYLPLCYIWSYFLHLFGVTVGLWRLKLHWLAELVTFLLYIFKNCINFNVRDEWKQHKRMGLPTDNSAKAAVAPPVNVSDNADC